MDLANRIRWGKILGDWLSQSVQQIERLSLVSRTQMGIPKGHGQGLMNQKLLDVLQRTAPHDELTGKCIPQVMESEIVDPCPFDCTLDYDRSSHKKR